MTVCGMGEWVYFLVFCACSINSNDLRKFLTKINNKTLQGRFRQVFQVYTIQRGGEGERGRGRERERGGERGRMKEGE